MASKLSIIIITRNTRELLRGLLDSIEKDISLRPLLTETIIVDNASDDNTEEMVRLSFPHVIYIKNKKNMGFAKSANMGFSKTTGDYILFLNSDTIVLPGEIKKIIDFMEKEGSAGICAPQLVYSDMRPQRSFAYVPRLLFEIVPRSFLEFLFPKKYERKNRTFIGPKEVESLIGAAFMVRRKTFDMLSGFDERFFFFLEETDLCVRARKENQGVVFYPDAKIIHLQGKTVSKMWIKGRIEYNISLYKFIRKHHSLFYYSVFKSIRFTKAVFLIVFLTVFPVLLLGRHTKRSYRYYWRLFVWHIKGCQEDAGLNDLDLKA